MDWQMLTQPDVRQAIHALQSDGHASWLAQLSPAFAGKGQPAHFLKFREHAMRPEHFSRIDRAESQGLEAYGAFQGDRGGEFKTCFKFRLDGDG